MWGRDAEEIDLSIEEEQAGPAAAAAAPPGLALAAEASADEEAAEDERAEERAARLHDVCTALYRELGRQGFTALEFIAMFASVAAA